MLTHPTGQFAPPASYSMAPPPPSPPRPPPDDATGDDAYARRLGLSGAAVPPPPPSPPTDGAGGATTSRAPVRYEQPPPPPPPADAMDIDSDGNSEANSGRRSPPGGGDAITDINEGGDAPRANRPGQAGFAARLMSKYGWTKGSGLGASESGIVNPLRVQVEKRKKRSDAEGGGYAEPAGRAKIIGGGTKRKKTGGADGGGDEEEEEGFGKMSDVIVLRNMLEGMPDLASEVEDGLGQEIGEECGEKVSCAAHGVLAQYPNVLWPFALYDAYIFPRSMAVSSVFTSTSMAGKSSSSLPTRSQH